MLPNATQSFILTVTQAPAITSANNTTFTVGTAGSFTVTATGFPTPALTESGALPSGVTFVDNGNGTATLSGIPSAAGTYPLSFTAANGVLPDATQSFTLTVTPSTSATVSAVSVSWGKAGTAALQTAADGLRLLPAGRNTDLPWLGINKLAITLEHAGVAHRRPTSRSPVDHRRQLRPGHHLRFGRRATRSPWPSPSTRPTG